MQPFPDVSRANELLTTGQMAEADRLAALAGVPGLTLMEAAGRAVADVAARVLSDRGRGEHRITVLAGPGNNGGDGFVAARLLQDRGFAVRLVLAGDRARLTGDAAHMAAAWERRGAIAPLGDGRDAFGDADLMIDALFGAGLTRPLEVSVQQVVELLNGTVGRPVVAVDVPSGLDGNTGRPVGRSAVRASHTVTFFRLKPGHALYPGRALCGEIVLADIGIPDAVLWPPNDDLEDDAQLTLPASVLTYDTTQTELITRCDAKRALTDHRVHKYARGHALVVSGPAHRTGAARLAARAALRTGAGLVTVASPPDAVAVNAAHLTAIMIAPFDGADGLDALLSDDRITALVIGPATGVGAATCALVKTALVADPQRHHLSIVLDADALTSFADDPQALFDAIAPADAELVDIHRASPRVVLTPHDGEFARLFPDLEGSRLDRARAAADRSGAVVLLKGADTVIATPKGDAAIATNGPPWLATAGSGDVLAGLIAGELAMGRDAYMAARAAVWLHGEAANRFGPGLIAEDLPEQLPAVLRGFEGVQSVV